MNRSNLSGGRDVSALGRRVLSPSVGNPTKPVFVVGFPTQNDQEPNKVKARPFLVVGN